MDGLIKIDFLSFYEHSHSPEYRTKCVIQSTKKKYLELLNDKRISMFEMLWHPIVSTP